jgi:hypothetical protein
MIFGWFFWGVILKWLKIENLCLGVCSDNDKLLREIYVNLNTLIKLWNFGKVLVPTPQKLSRFEW